MLLLFSFCCQTSICQEMKFSEADGTKNVAIISKCCCISDISQLVTVEGCQGRRVKTSHYVLWVRK